MVSFWFSERSYVKAIMNTLRKKTSMILNCTYILIAATIHTHTIPHYIHTKHYTTHTCYTLQYIHIHHTTLHTKKPHYTILHTHYTLHTNTILHYTRTKHYITHTQTQTHTHFHTVWEIVKEFDPDSSEMDIQVAFLLTGNSWIGGKDAQPLRSTRTWCTSS